jgi:hypothetical protein
MLLNVTWTHTQNEQYLSEYNSITLKQIMQEYVKAGGASQMLSNLGGAQWQIHVH